MRLRGALLTLVIVVTSPMPARPATGCPDVDAAQEMLANAASNENSRVLEAARKQGPAEQGKQASPGLPPPETSPAVALVKEAATACQAGDKAATSEKARAAMALLRTKWHAPPVETTR